MTLFYTHTVTQAAQRLILDIGLQTDASIETVDLPRLEHTARALCGQLKALEGLDSCNARESAKSDQQSYTHYEDLPPLRPEERDRLMQKFIDLLDPKRLEGTGDDTRRLPKKTDTQH